MNAEKGVIVDSNLPVAEENKSVATTAIKENDINQAVSQALSIIIKKAPSTLAQPGPIRKKRARETLPLPYAYMFVKKKKCRVVCLKRVGGRIKEQFDVYIGRACFRGGWELAESKWHNPYSIAVCGTAEKAVAAFETYLKASPVLTADIHELKGKVLGCWCKKKHTDICHGDVLAKLANALSD